VTTTARPESGRDGAAPVALSNWCTLRVGGPARRLVSAHSADEAVAVVRGADETQEPLLIIGGGSNVVVGDDGWPGTVLVMQTRGIAKTDTCGAGTVEVAAGENWDDAVFWAVAHGLAGVECLAGIPGSTGATPIQNVGAYGQEVADSIQRVRVYDRRERRERHLRNEDCGFAYRDSVFKREPGRFVVLGVEFRWERSEHSKPVRYGELARTLGIGVGDRAPLDDVRAAVLHLRRGKGMVCDDDDHDTWSVGSFFTNPIVDRRTADALPREAPIFAMGDGRYKTSAAWLIQESGFEPGFRRGAAAVSDKHTLAITNRGGATAAEILELARVLRAGVLERFGVLLQPEPVLVGCEL
jgi:UDP-N-acetylmuramate dehydrogenase